jgi:hypothetical protein
MVSCWSDMVKLSVSRGFRYAFMLVIQLISDGFVIHIVFPFLLKSTKKYFNWHLTMRFSSLIRSTGLPIE